MFPSIYVYVYVYMSVDIQKYIWLPPLDLFAVRRNCFWIFVPNQIQVRKPRPAFSDMVAFIWKMTNGVGRADLKAVTSLNRRTLRCEKSGLGIGVVGLPGIVFFRPYSILAYGPTKTNPLGIKKIVLFC